MAHKVELQVYNGPLDLLLWLISREEVDVYDIPIAMILTTYVEELEHAARIDINSAGDFLVMASTLMEIKSRMLLPVEDRGPEEEDEVEDPRAELVRQLLAFRAFKEVSQDLERAREARLRRYSRGRPIELPGDDAPREPEPLKDVTLFDLADGYARLLKETVGSGPRTIVYDDISMDERIKAIRGALAVRPEFALGALFGAKADAVQAAGVFFAVLELVNQRAVRVYQTSDFGEILVKQRKGDDAGGDEMPPDVPQPASSLPPAINRSQAPPDGKFRAPGRKHFAGIVRPGLSADAGADADDDGDADGDREGDDGFIAADDSEARLQQRIDRILKLADEITERYEASRKGRVRTAEGEGAAAALDAEAAQLASEADGEDGPEDRASEPAAGITGDGEQAEAT